MKIAIIFASVHHGNTRKVVEQIAQNNDVDLIDATQEKEKDLSAVSYTHLTLPTIA